MCNNHNNFFTVGFKSNLLFLNFDKIPVHYNDMFHVIIKDVETDMYISRNVNKNHWYCLGKEDRYSQIFFKYDIKLLNFDGINLKIIDTHIYDINNHQFYLSLFPRNESEFKIWMSYIEILEKTLNKKIDYKINEEYKWTLHDNLDSIIISHEMYDTYIKGTPNPFLYDYSSLSIIKTLFNIM